MKPESTDAQTACGRVRDLSPSIGSKWAVSLVALLEHKPQRFSELKRAMGEITQKSLTAALRELERDGLVTRTVTPTIPPRVDYALTPLGRSLLEPVRALGNWALDNEAELTAARARFAGSEA